MLAYIQAIALRRQDTPKHLRVQTYLFIDEVANYVGDSIEEIMTESRKFGLSLFMSSQIVGQKMNTELTDIIMSNATLKIVGKNAVKSLKAMGANMDIPLQQLKKIPKYQFYIHNKDTNRPAQLIKSPDFLVKQKDEPSYFYLSKKDQIALLEYFVHESGYYVHVPKNKAVIPAMESTDRVGEEQLLNSTLIPF